MPPFEPEPFEPRRRGDLVVTLFFLLLAGVLIVLPPEVQEQVAGGLRATVLSPFLLLQESLIETRVRVSEVSELQRRLNAATAALAAQSTLRQENTHLRRLLELRDRAGPGFRSASVLRPGLRGSESMFLLDVGSRDGVAVNDPVVSDGGLVGVIREVGRGTSVAMDWTHPDFRVSVMTLDGEAFGLIEPRQGAFREEDRLLLNGVPYYTSLERGTAVVTSGQGSVYPRGILVGTVDELAETEAGWRRGYWIVPAVRPAAVSHVLVMTEAERSEEHPLEELWLDSLPTAPEGPETLQEIEVLPGEGRVPEVDPDAHGPAGGPGDEDPIAAGEDPTLPDGDWEMEP